jgi:plastocyanin
MFIFITIVVALPGPPASAVDEGVSVEDNRFAPRDVAIVVGDDVAWTRTEQALVLTHVVRLDRPRRSGPVTEGPIEFAATFSAGSFHYFCEAHGSQVGGMVGVVRVPPVIGEDPPGRRFMVTWATDETSTGSRFDVQFRRGSGRWEEWKEDTRAFRGVYGRRGQPERVRDGARYRFRARSSRGGAESRWSPVASFLA